MKFTYVIILVVLASSCSISSFHTATPIPEGTNEIGGFVGGSYFSPDLAFMSERVESSSKVYGDFGLAYRRGLSDWSDLGVQLGMGTLQIDYNIALINTADFALSIDPKFQILLTTPLRARLGIYADVFKATSGTIISLNVAPGYSFFDGGPSLSGGILTKLSVNDKATRFFVIYVDGEASFDIKVTQQIITAGFGLTFGF